MHVPPESSSLVPTATPSEANAPAPINDAKPALAPPAPSRTPPAFRWGSTRRGLLKGAPSVAFVAGSAAMSKTNVARAEVILPQPQRERRAHAAWVRAQAAAANFLHPFPNHPTNEDDQLYPNRIGSYTKGLPHNDRGEVDPAAYEALRRALAGGRQEDFERVPLGGVRKLVNPLGGRAFDLEGLDSHQTRMPPAPALASAQTTAEAVELYWMALLRDVPFEEYAGHPLAERAAEELSQLPELRAPRRGGRVTTQTLFREPVVGADVGPYLSQFFWLFAPFGAEFVERRIRTAIPGQDFLTSFGEWLPVQSGARPLRTQSFDPVRRYVRNGRDLSEWVHIDVLFQAYFDACLTILATPLNTAQVAAGQQGGIGVPLNPSNPYRALTKQDPFVTFGGPFIKTLMCEVSTRALKAVWFHKWFVHRRLRPEKYGALVDGVLNRGERYPLGSAVLASHAVAQTQSRFGSAFLPQAYPEGAPLHPAYGAGHAVVAGACVTILKAMFDGNFVIPNPVVASNDGTALVPYQGASLTVTGELNKLAANVATGRNIAGVHYRSDGVEALRLGEEVAISILRDTRLTLVENFSGWTFTKLDGTSVTV